MSRHVILGVGFDSDDSDAIAELRKRVYEHEHVVNAAVARVEALCDQIDAELDAIAETYGVETTERVTERIRAALKETS